MLNVTVPGNTKADVCLPAALLPRGAVLRLDGAAAASRRPQRGQLCLSEQLGGGRYSVVAEAAETGVATATAAKSDDAANGRVVFSAAGTPAGTHGRWP